jgi:hypothetical protein
MALEPPTHPSPPGTLFKPGELLKLIFAHHHNRPQKDSVEPRPVVFYSRLDLEDQTFKSTKIVFDSHLDTPEFVVLEYGYLPLHFQLKTGLSNLFYKLMTVHYGTRPETVMASDKWCQQNLYKFECEQARSCKRPPQFIPYPLPPR